MEIVLISPFRTNLRKSEMLIYTQVNCAFASLLRAKII